MTTKSDAECEAAIRQFSEITECDEAFAHAILQDVDYDLETALAKHFSGQAADVDAGTAAVVAVAATENDGNDVVIVESQSNGTHKTNGPAAQPSIHPVDNVSLDEFFDYNDDSAADEDEAEPDEKEENNEEERETLAREIRQNAERQRRANELPMELTMMSWNVDGLDEGNRDKRFKAVLYLIAKRNPEVIFLQEVVPEHMPQLMDLMEGLYNIFISNTEFAYFCVTLTSKNLHVLHDEVVAFPGTGMGRAAIVVDIQWQRLKLRLINSHLESTADFAEKRRQQLALCFEKAMEVADDTDHMAIFAGDLNVRETEVPPLPAGLKDAWLEDGGGKRETRFTWDLRRNDNHNLQSGARLRFDRVYFRGGPFRRVDFALDGLQRIRNVHCFPSDHFAVVCRFYDIAVRQ